MKLASGRRMLVPLGNRGFRLLWSGQTISALGNAFQAVAVVWYVLQQQHGSPSDLALALLALSVPQIPLTLAGGSITDRLDPRTVMLWSDAVRMSTSATMAVLALSDSLPFWLLCVLLAAHSLATGLFNPASGSIAPRLVPQDQLDGANSLMTLVSQLGMLLGALPAGIVVATLGTGAAFGINALSFAGAVLLTLLIPPLSRPAQDVTHSLLTDIREGAHYLLGFPWLMALLGLDACAAVASIGPITVGLPLLARDVLHAGAQGYSLLLWSFGVGSAVGMVLSGIFTPAHKRGNFLCLVQLLEAPLLAGVAFAPLPLAMCCLAGAGLLNGMLSVLFLSLIQTNVAREKLGRVMGFYMLASVGLMPLSQYGSGVFASVWGTQALFLVAGTVILCSAVASLSLKSLRNLD